MALISIIVPCYNAEQYVDRCMETIVRQTIGIENLEIILVNDASTDDTLNKLKIWEKQYPDQIIVITYDNNLRQGGARNIGMQYASAEYIGFVDIDDWIELDMYETLYEPLKSVHYDIVRGKSTADRYFNNDPVDNSLAKDNLIFDFEKKGDFYQYDVDERQIDTPIRWGGIWAGIYSKSCIIDNNVMFPEKLAYEDNYWNNVLKLYVRNMCIVDKVIYHYFINDDSTSHARNAGFQFDRLKIEIGILDEYKKRGAFNCLHDQLERGFIQRFLFKYVTYYFYKI